MNELTKAEEQLMQILWKIKKGFVKDIISHLKEPKPAYNTVSTIVRILVKKGFVAHRVYGNTHEYYPLIAKKDYSKSYFKNFLGNYFNNSFKKLVSFFSKENNFSIQELEELQNLIQKEIEKKSKKS